MDVPTLKRPLVFVHGYTGWANQGKPLADFLTQNPENEYGGTFHADREDEFRQSVREHGASAVYTVALSNPRAGYHETSPEFTRAIEILNEETGLEADAVGHSMGGMVIRDHLDRGHEGLHNIFMEGTPNHGMPGTVVTDAVVAAAAPVLGSAPKALQADKRTLSRGHNRTLKGINDRWPEQREKVNRAYTIAGTRIPTVSSKFPYLAKGDGLVAEESVKLEGATHVTVGQLDPGSFALGDNHVTMINNPRVLAFIADEVTREDEGHS